MAAIPPGFELDAGTDPAEDHIGPFYASIEGEDFVGGLMPEAHHGNSMGIVHGGVLLTFADYVLCAHARVGTLDDHIVTVSLNADFISGAQVDCWVYSQSQIVRRTGSMVFVQGQLLQEERPVLTFSGVGKRWQNP